MTASTALWFDLDGTVLQYDRGFEGIFREIAGELPDGAFDTYSQRLFRAMDEHEDEPYVCGFEAVVEQHGVDAEPASLAEDYLTAELEATVVTEETLSLIERAGKNGPVGILTNGAGGVQRQKIEAHGLDEHIDEVVISGEVGERKPGLAIFELAKQRVDAENHVYVGDTYGEDIKPARQAGFATVHVRNDDGSEVSVDRLESLGTILHVLE